ncbi:PREDICTED: F-box/LRR-repeat protein 25-like [Camelina sativa]|uniref:F-box/LRR-repeat protein 25-like n=1 Tax=Camelina sativa TaxID=90675 RepID=A0ABM0Y3X4_CAMSA|nr:PREDICTED: F-box/LRR-repeat protein 25-like [Camelina sativa]
MKLKEEHATVAVRNPSHRFERPLKLKRSSDDSIADLSSIISDLPDEILQHILSYIPTKLAITTSVLSKRWRHVWKETPHLSFEWLNVFPEVINDTLARYSASKITSFQLYTNFDYEVRQVDKSIEFAMSHNVENFSLALGSKSLYSFPDFSYTNSSMKRVNLKNFYLIPMSTVSWTSLRNLSLGWCELSDESFLKVLSGCPILETLTLHFCRSLKYLDLSKSLRLRRLEMEIERKSRYGAPFQSMQVVAPHVHYLSLRDCEAHCTFVDVSSLIEADVDVSYFHPRTKYDKPLDPNDLLVTAQKMIEAFQNVEKLTLGVNLLQMLSLSKIPSLPMLKVNNLTLETRIMRSVVPGVERLLQNSPGLNKLTVYNTTERCHTQLWECVDGYLKKQCWRLEDKVFPTSCYNVVEPKVVSSFMELLLANTKTLETLVVHLSTNCVARSRFEELSQIALTLSHNNNVSIVLKQTGG